MENELIHQSRNQLKDRVLRRTPKPGLYPTAIDGLTLFRSNDGGCQANCFYQPLFSIPLQGFKRSTIGSDHYDYGENQCLAACVDVPATSTIVDATIEKPFVAITLGLDKFLVSGLITEMPDTTLVEMSAARATEVVDLDLDILNAFSRLEAMLDHKDQIPILAPLIIREIHYRLLISPVGHILRMLHTSGSPCNQIARAIAWLRENFKEPLQVEKLAEQSSMSVSHFHRRFKQITTLSPIQYQKQLRLHEAQRLMLAEDTTAYHAALAVGYDSSTQFNREYKRLFGEPPQRDIKRLARTP